MKVPVCHLIAGPNGAGKSTFALEYLPTVAKCTEFINADLIAAGLSPLHPASAALSAGRLVLKRIGELSEARRSFGFESTLSGRTYLATLRELKEAGYRLALHYLWLPLPQLATLRVRSRVRMGGHHVPTADIIRRFKRSLENLDDYQQLADDFFLYEAAEILPKLIFTRNGAKTLVHQPELLSQIPISFRQL